MNIRLLQGSLRSKLWLGFAALLAILVAVSAMSIAVLTHYSHSMEETLHSNYDSAVYCQEMQGALDQLNAHVLRRIWNDPSSIDTAAQIRRFDENLKQQGGNITLPDERELTQQLADAWNKYHRRFANLETAGDRRTIYRDELLPLYDQIKSISEQIARLNMSEMAKVNTQAEQNLLEVRKAVVVLALAGFLLAVALVGPVAAGILKPLKQLIGSARRIEQGDLDLTVPVTSRDEVGQLAEAFNSMAKRLREFRRIDQDKLVRTQQTTQLAIDSLPDGVCVFSPEGVVEISNRTASAHFGIVPGAKVEDLHQTWLSKLFFQVMSDGKAPDPQGYQSAVQLFEEGVERFLLPRAVPMFDRDHRILGVTVILVDVTRLRHGDELKSALVSTVSHELRTPLTSVRMTVNMLADPKFGMLNDRQQQMLKAAQDDSERLFRIVNHLLNMSRIESGSAQFQFRLMPASEIATEAVESLRKAFDEKGIELRERCEANGTAVMADATCISLALANLLGNALKYTPAGGHVNFDTKLRDGEVCFTVSDDGPGIPSQYVPRLFERFFRIPREGASGAGLGLSIAKEIAEAHGGKVEFVTGAGPGCTFTLTLPESRNRS